MPCREEILLVVVDSDATDEVNSVTATSSCSNDRVARSASFFRSALKDDLAVIAAHNDKLASTKCNNVTTHSSAPVDNTV